MKKSIKLAATILFAVFLAWFGGLARPYSAFGGEDVLALCVTAQALYNYFTKDKRRENQ